MVSIVFTLLVLTVLRISLSNAEKRVAEHPNHRIRAAGESVEVLIIATCVVFLVIRPFCAQAFYIPSVSMSPTLQVNDRLLVNKLVYKFTLPKRNDVVVFHAPDKAIEKTVDGPDLEEKDFVKRVIGLPGDTIEVHGGIVYVNGEPHSEAAKPEPPNYDLAPFTVPRGKLFVLGDNRNHSNDSHRWGALDRTEIVGKAVFIFWPPSRVGAIR
jgi:signal peptidase I